MKIINKIYLILGIIFFAIGIVKCIQWKANDASYNAWYLIHFLPSAVFFLAYVVGRNIRRKIIHVIAIPLCIVAFLFWGLFSSLWGMTPHTVTNKNKYEQSLEQWYRQELVAHFPRKIPPDAKKVQFSYIPRFLQGGAHIQLRYSAPADTIAQLYNRFSPINTKSFIGGDRDAHTSEEEGMPTTFFFTSGTDERRFPSDFEIMIFDKVLNEEERKQVSWDNGVSHGVAISKTRSEIVYWAEDW